MATPLGNWESRDWRGAKQLEEIDQNRGFHVAILFLDLVGARRRISRISGQIPACASQQTRIEPIFLVMEPPLITPLSYRMGELSGWFYQLSTGGINKSNWTSKNREANVLSCGGL